MSSGALSCYHVCMSVRTGVWDRRRFSQKIPVAVVSAMIYKDTYWEYFFYIAVFSMLWCLLSEGALC